MCSSMIRYILQPWLLMLILIWSKIAYTRHIIVGGSVWESLYIEIPVLVVMIVLIEWIWQTKPRARYIVYVLINSVLSFVFFALIIYYRYFNTLATYTSLFDLGQAGDVTASIATLIRPQYYLLFADIPVLMAAAMVWRILRKRRRTEDRLPALPVRNRYGFACVLAAMTIALLNVLQAIGGGTVNELVKAKDMGLITYQAYAVYADAKRMLSKDQQTISPEAIRRVKGIRLAEDPAWHGIAEGKDVYVVQLESFHDWVIGLEVEGQEVTPNLNRLLDESFYFDRVYQQIGKGNTSDAEFVMNTSLYPTGIMPMSRQTAGMIVPSLPRYLKPYGYESVTMHTNEVKFWDRNLMYQALGFDAYYDKEFFGEEDYLHFGASDEVLFRRSIEVFLEIKERGKPIYANLITMSNHNPFELPDEKRMLKLPDHLAGTFLGNYLESVHYADYAIGIWIEELEAHGLWEDAMLVIYGDHFGVSDTAAEEDLEAAAELLSVGYYSKEQMFNVPLIIRVPGLEEGVVRHNMGGQIDILPTIMNLLGIRYDDLIIFGQDLLNHERNLIGQRTYLPSGSFINEEVIFIPGAGLEDGWMVPLEDPLMETKSPLHYRDDYHRALKLLNMSDAYIASLPMQEAVPVMAATEE